MFNFYVRLLHRLHVGQDCCGANEQNARQNAIRARRLGMGIEFHCNPLQAAENKEHICVWVEGPFNRSSAHTSGHATAFGLPVDSNNGVRTYEPTTCGESSPECHFVTSACHRKLCEHCCGGNGPLSNVTASDFRRCLGNFLVTIVAAVGVWLFPFQPFVGHGALFESHCLGLELLASIAVITLGFRVLHSSRLPHFLSHEFALSFCL